MRGLDLAWSGAPDLNGYRLDGSERCCAINTSAAATLVEEKRLELGGRI